MMRTSQPPLTRGRSAATVPQHSGSGARRRAPAGSLSTSRGGESVDSNHVIEAP